jgi:signal transduction histidine kinase
MQKNNRSKHQERSLIAIPILHYIQGIFTRPFRINPAEVATLTVAQSSQARRNALLRMFLFCVGFSILVIAVPLVLITQQPPIVLVALLILIGLSLGGFLLTEQGFGVLAGMIFVMGGIIGTTIYASINPGGIDIAVLTGFVTFPLFILIAGLIFPPWLMAVTVITSVASTALSFAFVHPDYGRNTLFSTPSVQIGTAFQLISVQLLTTLISWIAARASNSGVQAATKAFEQERELTRLKDQFIDDANHELRTPIMAWFGSTELLAQMDDALPTERKRRIIARALRSGEQVLHLLNSILDATNIEARTPQLTMTSFKLAPLVNSILETFDARTIGEIGLRLEMVIERDFHVSISPDIQVWADEARLQQVLTNLISNALKYSPAGSPLEIEAEPWLLPSGAYDDHLASPSVVIRVRDHGLGIPEQDISKLFRRFTRLERDIAGPVRGTGVGLYMSRILVEAMGGKIWVESKGIPGEGSTFIFTLPISSKNRI